MFLLNRVFERRQELSGQSLKARTLRPVQKFYHRARQKEAVNPFNTAEIAPDWDELAPNISTERGDIQAKLDTPLQPFTRCDLHICVDNPSAHTEAIAPAGHPVTQNGNLQVLSFWHPGRPPGYIIKNCPDLLWRSRNGGVCSNLIDRQRLTCSLCLFPEHINLLPQQHMRGMFHTRVFLQ